MVRIDIRNDIKLLIELSCVSLENKELFESFHKMLIAISYEATDVCIDYRRKRIYMNVVAEDRKGDFLNRLDNSVPTTICLNLTYDNLGSFLKDSIKDKNSFLRQYYPLLKEQFFKGKSLFEELRTLEKA